MEEREPRKRKCHQHESEKVRDKRNFQEYSIQQSAFTYFQVLKNSQKNLLSSKAVYQTHFSKVEHHLDSFNSTLEIVDDLYRALGP